jgi:endonuclease-8
VEGPSLVILRQEMKPFVGQTILHAEGNWKMDASQFTGKRLRWIKTWGKHYIMRIGDVVTRTHFLLWGSYRINDRKDRSPTLRMEFENGEVNFYSSSIRILEEPVEELYDWRVDVMSRKWDAKYVRSLVKQHPNAYVTDVLLDQNIFAGVGNIIKNEVLSRLRMAPLTRVKQLTPKRLTALVEDAHTYSHLFYKWKKKYVLKKHYTIYHKGVCPHCGGKVKAQILGKRERYTYWCPVCQK